jgi:hypothetical protein
MGTRTTGRLITGWLAKVRLFSEHQDRPRICCRLESTLAQSMESSERPSQTLPNGLISAQALPVSSYYLPSLLLTRVGLRH